MTTDLGSSVTPSNMIHIIRIPEGKEREKGAENVFDETIAENFPNLGSETEIQMTVHTREAP